MKRNIILILCTFLFTVSLHAELKVPDRHPLDKRQYEKFVLKNGIKVLLIFDPNFNKSAASLDVAVGALSDPKDRQGLAHFLEHMLFLGTKKYPDVDEYFKYLKSRGGYANAFTAGNRTNYQFQVFHEAFEGALDRFAQFFIAPLFNPEYTSREVKAVDSEHQKNLLNDIWRRYQLLKSFYRKDHPAHKFSTGNLKTLSKVNSAELKEFYQQHYSANRMTLVLLSSNSLSWMREKVEKYFSEIENKSLKPIKYPKDYLPQEETFRTIKLIPIKDERSLLLEFSLPSTTPFYKSKPTEVMSFCIGHEGKGSLLSLLKEENLATSLSAGGYENTQDYGSFTVQINLTKKGLKEYRKIVRMFFAYVKLLKTSKFPMHVFHEMKTLKRLEDVYADKGEGTGQAVKFAGYLQKYPLEIVEKYDYLLEKPGEEIFREILSYLKPSNMFCILSSQNQKVDKEEPIYGSKYAYETDAKFYQVLTSTPIEADLSLPIENPFIPKDAQVLSSRPNRLIKRDGFELWYAQDTEFKRPKVDIRFEFLVPKKKISLRFQALLNLYVRCIQEELVELSYPAGQAGLGYSISGNLESITVHISGYHDSSPKLLNYVIDQLKRVDLQVDRYLAIRDDMLKGLRNFKKEQAYKIIRLLSRRIHTRIKYHPDEIADVTENLSLKDVQKFAKEVLNETYVQGLIVGNVTEYHARKIAEDTYKKIQPKVLRKKDAFLQGFLQQPHPEVLNYYERLETNNSCFRRNYFLGADSPKMRMTAAVLNNFVNQPFFTELRTKQQLGYIVWGGSHQNRLYHYLVFIIQSASYSADLLSQKADAFIKTLPEQLKAMKDEDFEMLKKAVRERLLEKEKSISNRASVYFDLTFKKDRDFDRKQKNLEALSKLTIEDMVLSLRKALDSESRKMTEVLLFAAEHQPKDGDPAQLTDLKVLKSKRKYKTK